LNDGSLWSQLTLSMACLWQVSCDCLCRTQALCMCMHMEPLGDWLTHPRFQLATHILTKFQAIEIARSL